MAKYCVKCGRQLLEGQEYCPICHVEGRDSDAAPFTQISAESEFWNNGRGRHERTARTRLQRQSMWYSFGAAAVAALAAGLILYIQPVNQVIRALNRGAYDRAREIYLSDAKLQSGEYGNELDRAILRAARSVYDDYANHKLDALEATAALSALRGIGTHSEELLADTLEDIHSVTGSQSHMERGDALAAAGDYLAAREEYLLVSPSDSDYALAQSNAARCLERYAEDAIAEANRLIQAGDYAGAIMALEGCGQVLLDYDLYVEALGYKLSATYQLYDDELLSKAADKAAVEDYSGAAELLEAGMERFQRQTEALTAAVASYRDQAGGKTLTDAVTEAHRLASAGDWSGAFVRLEAAEESALISPGDAAAAISELEAEFVQNRLEAAKAALDGGRENVAQATELIDAALRVRPLEALREYRGTLAQYLPASLADIDYADKNGAVFRNSGVFEGLDGVNYSDGWIWGENGAEVTFQLNGAYDLLEGVLSTRRDDTVQATGYFELYCDGALVYVSEALHHPDKVSSQVSARISGCNVLMVRFVNDYSVRTVDDGYCYHGFCSPTVTKDLPE